MNAIRHVAIVLALVSPASLPARRPPRHPIGKVTTIGNLIHLELDSGAVAPERLFDLDHRTLRFTPGGTGYRVYLMGLAKPEEVPPFFILRNLQRTAQQDAGATRSTKVTRLSSRSRT